MISGSPAADAGLEAGDIITAVDRIPVDQDHSLPDVIGQYQPGDRVTIHFWRTGEEDAALVELAEHPDNAAQAYLGVYFAMLQVRSRGTPGDQIGPQERAENHSWRMQESLSLFRCFD